MHRRRLGAALACALVSLAADCMADDHLVEPSIGEVSGEWQATYILASGTNYVDLGWSIDLTLRNDGTTSGRFFAPGAGEDGEDVDEDLTGTWQLAEYEVTLDHEADTFLRDVTFEWTSPGTLVADGTGADPFRVVLARDGPVAD